MFRTLGWALLILVALHLVAAGLFVGWLGWSGRLSRERLERVVHVFRPTVAQDQSESMQAAHAQKQAKAVAARQAHLKAVANGAQTLSERLDAEQENDALAQHQLARFKQERRDLQLQMRQARQLLNKEKADLAAKRQAFEKRRKAQQKKQKSADFKQTVSMLEKLRSKQAKQVFQQMLAQGKTDDVVDYLAAMQLRKAAYVLQEFKSPQEVAQATMLIQKLAKRGVYPVGQSGDSMAEAKSP